MICQHKTFAASVKVSRLTDSGRFMADICVKCDKCNEPFHFRGVPFGVSFEQPMVSVDGLELRAPIAPGIVPPLGVLQ